MHARRRPRMRIARLAGGRPRRGSVLVQAPAGSGKTTLLAQRYLRLLATVDAPERILALTFTRRAARGDARAGACRRFGARRDSAPHARPANPETWALAVDRAPASDALAIDIERQPSRLRIETIDSFNAWLAGQLPITAGAGAGLRVLEDARPCYEEAARACLGA